MSVEWLACIPVIFFVFIGIIIVIFGKKQRDGEQRKVVEE